MDGFLKITGDLSRWNIYRKAACVSDVTEMFIRRAFSYTTRTIDQMRQAARSCKQNIVEGITDSTVSMEMGIKLVGVARGSLRELMEDYTDYLYQNDLKVWKMDDHVTSRARRFCKECDDRTEFKAKSKFNSTPMENINTTIENEAQYNWAMSRIDELLPQVNDDTPDNDPNSIGLYLLSRLVQEYEDVHYPVGEPSLIDILKLRMYEMGLSQAALAKKIGVSPSRICDFLSGKAEPTLKVGRRISTELQIDPAIVLGV